MELWLRIYKHLLPRARAWSITVEKQLRQFFEGLTGLPSDARNYFAGILLDIFPTTTTALDEWAEQFNFVRTGNDAVDRQTLQDAWILNEYQSPKQIQDTLQAAGFDIYLHEWWKLPATQPPEPKNPNLYLASLQIGEISLAGESFMFAGESQALAGVQGLVQKPLFLTGLDEPTMLLDDSFAVLDNFIQPVGIPLVNKTDIETPYQIPPNPDFWPYFIYFGAENFPDFAQIPLSRKNEFETLLLKINPSEQWIGLLVEYV